VLFDKTRKQVAEKVTRPVQSAVIIAGVALVLAIVALFVAVTR
jgi:uncharacterized membrane protein YidH (DUF202 family)